MICFPDLTNKNIWITGGAGYLGTPIVLALDKIGARTICIDLPGKAEALCAEHNLKNTLPESADLCAVDGIPDVVDRLTNTYGIPDGFVHLAFASSSGKSLDELGKDDFQRTMEGSLAASFLLSRSVSALMKQHGSGSVILFASMYGIVPPDPAMYVNAMKPNPIDYGVAKAGTLQMMRYFAVHHGPHGVRFNCITPGAFPNPTVQTANPDFIELQKKKIPMARIGEASEIVGPTLFLLSNASSYITGHSLVVDGGWTTW